ncbi:hypothetical protein [Nocardioides euryhalodurans]|uniref:Sulfotransferase family protein n=1 Tax=Nocardioides euryhalodurans TaxID=2518370 RepID=A0A4P7GNN6_9ACTN|nr:hypothetical protein [Nocardioides euryhalodurans]QBR93381.1 hypothetical protein EXE57_14735 [Nocardioides euryhalodurans]
MVERVVLHVGTMKSGTTYLQRVLDTGVLESAGGFYAGGSFKAQARAVDSLPQWTERRPPRAWRALAQRVQHRPGTAFYSHEFLSFASRKRVRRVVESFGGTPVDVVLTVRDQHSAIPAQWQTFVRNSGVATWEEYVRGLETVLEGGQRRRTPAETNYRRAQGVQQIVARWGGDPGVSSVAVALVPPPGSAPQLLWQRFCEAAGIEAPEPPDVGTRLNPSLGYASCEVVRLLNPSLAGMRRPEPARARRVVLGALLSPREPEARPVLDRTGGDLARELNQRILRVLERRGVRVVGSAGDLPVTGGEGEASSIPPPDPTELRRAAEHAWERCVPGVALPPGDVDDVVAELGRRLATRFGP